MHFTKPSDGYSFLHKAFLKASGGWERYCDFADWWDFNNFQLVDYEEQEYNSKTMMSTVEQAYIHYAKDLTIGKFVTNDDPLGFAKREIDTDRVAAFLGQLDDLIQKHPSYIYPPYYKSKLLLLNGSKEQALTEFLPFAKLKKNDFWVWDLMAEIYKDEKDKCLASYCKAISCKIPGSFLVKTRQKFAEFLINHQYFDEARYEIDRLTTDREANGWRIPNKVLTWKQSDWYLKSEKVKSNKDFYNAHFVLAESLLFNNDPEVKVVITNLNQEKKIANYSIDKSNGGFFNYQGLIEKIDIGDIVNIRVQSVDDESGFTKVNTVRKNVDNKHPMLRIEEGVIRIKDEANFGFLGNTFVDPTIIGKYHLLDGQNINALSLLSFNKKKNEWGWKVIGKIE